MHLLSVQNRFTRQMPDLLQITVMYSPKPRVVDEQVIQLDAESTVLNALEHSGVLKRHQEIDLTQPENYSVCIWGRSVPPDQKLRDLDRVEIYRPLKVDPKVARRERFQKQGARTAGLFSKRRPGAKPGY